MSTNRTQIISILDNIDRITSLYERVLTYDDSMIDLLKTSIITINNINYSYYYLIRKTFYFINNNNIKIKIQFKFNVENNDLIYLINLIILSGEELCNNINCKKLFCYNGYHYFDKSNDINYKIFLDNNSDIMRNIEDKINDFKLCDICNKIWDQNSMYKIIQNDSNTCDNCNMTEHLNKKIGLIIDKCSICLKNMYYNTSIKTDCNHYYHLICLNTWLKNNNSCPLCRTVF